MKETEVELVTELVQRYCAIDAETEKDEVREGRFVLAQGRTSRGARVHSTVVRGSFERSSVEVLRRARALSTNGEGHVFVRFFFKGSTAMEDEVKVVGTMDAPEEDPDVDVGGSIGALTGALLKTDRLNRERIADLERRLDQHHMRELEQVEQFTMLAFHAAATESSQWSETLERTIGALSPLAEKIAPQLIERLTASGGAPLPAEPGARIDEGIKRIRGLVMLVAQTIQTNPAAATAERIAPLRELVSQLGPFLGLRVSPADAPAEEPADQADEQAAAP